MPYAAPISSVCTFAERRKAARQYEQAREQELARIAARVHAAIDEKDRREEFAGLVEFAKAGEIGPKE